VIIFLLVLLAVFPSVELLGQEGDSLRIMPLGDSITKGTGSTNGGGYRDDLYFDLTVQGIEFDFVGTQSQGEGFDPDHEGHGGKRADWLADSVGYFYDMENPDIILLHIGTNDITGERPIDDIIADIESILDQGKSHNPDMGMLVAGLVPRKDAYDLLTTDLNEEIFNLVQYKIWQGYDIKYADHNTAFKSNPDWEMEYFYDTRHPNDEGYSVMAQVWLDSLGLIPPPDTIPPSAVANLSVAETEPSTVKLAWNAPGDDGAMGMASLYDVRYSTSLITEENFDQALECRSEPGPLLVGSPQSYFVSGLSPGTPYYFALRSYDEVPNASPLSNVPLAVTTDDPTVFVDDFNREALGVKWVASDSALIVDDELTNIYSGTTGVWTVKAVYSYATNPTSAMFRYGEENTQVENGAVGLLMLRNSLNLNAARSYLIRYFNLTYQLYIVNNNEPPSPLGTPIQEPDPPIAGDLLMVIYHKAGSQNLFDVYLNGVFRGTLADTGGILDPEWYYAGVAFENAVETRIGSVDDFMVGGAVGNSPPHAFALISPEDSAMVGGDQTTFLWHEAEDVDRSSTVRYEFYVDVDSLFPSGPVVSDLAETLYVLDTSDFQEETYYWRIVAYDEFGDRTPALSLFSFLYRDGIGIEGPFAGSPDMPRVAGLSQNYPNPFNPTTVISYEVPLLSGKGSGEGLPVTLVVYDARGRRVKTLVDRAVEPGRHRVTWDGKDERGVSVPTGTYLSTLTVAGQRISRKMVLIR
jgi:lysophospholipase L1-like esterase